MDRRSLLIRAGATALLPVLGSSFAPSASSAAASAAKTLTRVRPSDPAWPDVATWQRLNQQVGGQLLRVHSPLEDCVSDFNDPTCTEFTRYARNPFYLGDEAGLTQNLGWVDAWMSRPSFYAVAARTTADVVTTSS